MWTRDFSVGCDVCNRYWTRKQWDEWNKRQDWTPPRRNASRQATKKVWDQEYEATLDVITKETGGDVKKDAKVLTTQRSREDHSDDAQSVRTQANARIKAATALIGTLGTDQKELRDALQHDNTTATRACRVCSKPVNSISGRGKGPRCSNGKKKLRGQRNNSAGRRRVQRTNTCRKMKERQVSTKTTSSKSRNRDGNSACHCPSGQHVISSETTCSVHRPRWCCRGPFAAREPCYSSQLDRGLSPARRRTSATVYHRHQRRRPIHGNSRLLHKRGHQSDEVLTQKVGIREAGAQQVDVPPRPARDARPCTWLRRERSWKTKTGHASVVDVPNL